MRRNNRSLQKFYDAQYIDTRTGQKASGQKLFSGRRTRDKTLNGENLRVYRGQKVSKGRVSIRRQRYLFQPGDLVRYEGHKYRVKGMQNYGAYIKLEGLPRPVKTILVSPVCWRKGIYQKWHTDGKIAVSDSTFIALTHCEGVSFWICEAGKSSPLVNHSWLEAKSL